MELIVAQYKGQPNCLVCQRPWKEHSFEELIACGKPNCLICKKLWKEHSLEEQRTCLEAECAEAAAAPCPNLRRA